MVSTPNQEDTMSVRKALQTPEVRFENRRLRPAQKPNRGFWEWLIGGYYRGG